MTTDELMISAFGEPDSFLLDEAVALINQHVVRKKDLRKRPAIEKLGYIAGVVTLNDEVEILIKFRNDELIQLNKRGFEALIAVVPDEK